METFLFASGIIAIAATVVLLWFRAQVKKQAHRAQKQ